MTNGQQIDICAQRISDLRDMLDASFERRNTFRKFDNLDQRNRRLIVVIVRELRLYRQRMRFICNGEDHSELLNRKMIRPSASHY